MFNLNISKLLPFSPRTSVYCTGMFALVVLRSMPAAATIHGYSGDVALAAAPACNYYVRAGSYTPGAFNPLRSSNEAWVFEERQCATLSVDMPVNMTAAGVPGVISAGTQVRSHYIYSQPTGGSSTYIGEVEFTTPILGVISGPVKHNASNYLGCANTVYPNTCGSGNLCALEGADTVNVSSPTKVEFELETYQKGDRIRVLTEC